MYKILCKRKWFILLGLSSVLLLGIIITFFIQKPVYESHAMLRVNYPLPEVEKKGLDNNLEGVVEAVSSFPQMTLETHIGQLKSEIVLNKVRERLKLENSRFIENINITALQNSNLIIIKARHHQPVLAMEIANVLSEEYIDFLSRMNQREVERSITFLKEQNKLIEEELYTAINTFNQLASYSTSARNQAQLAYWQAQIEHLRKSMVLLTERMVQTRIAGSINYGQTSVMVVSAATLPQKPVKPNKIVNIVLSFILGCFIFITGAFVVEHLDYRIKTVKDVEEFLQLPVLATIPVKKKIVAREDLP